MKSHYAKYLTEKTNDKIIETEDGFVQYRYLDNKKTVYITDIYLEPEKRLGKKSYEIADLVLKEAKELGYNELIGSVVPSNKNSTTSLHVLLGYGMKLHGAQNDFVIFRKDF